MNFQHLLSMTDDTGLFEHAKFQEPRIEHGYCVDDVARALIVIDRNQAQSIDVLNARKIYVNFLSESQTADGLIMNRRSVNGNWTSAPETNDHWGRALWAFGSAFRENVDPVESAKLLKLFEVSAKLRSGHLRSMLFASLGAIQVIHREKRNIAARKLLADTTAMIAQLPNKIYADYENWIWPERKLTYANAILPEVLLWAGNIFENEHLVANGKALLQWLLDVETRHIKDESLAVSSQSFEKYFSVTPTTGHIPFQPRERFDQQSIEVAALVDACASAYQVTNENDWLEYIRLGANWFEGLNDSNIMMYEPETGAGFDGLTRSGRNENCGAESTICYLSVADQFQRFFSKNVNTLGENNDASATYRNCLTA